MKETPIMKNSKIMIVRDEFDFEGCPPPGISLRIRCSDIKGKESYYTFDRKAVNSNRTEQQIVMQFTPRFNELTKVDIAMVMELGDHMQNQDEHWHSLCSKYSSYQVALQKAAGINTGDISKDFEECDKLAGVAPDRY